MELDIILKQLQKKKIFVISALHEETNNSSQIIHSGVGKVNAALCVMRVIMEKKPLKIINYGTAGKINIKLNGLVNCTKFIQHDIDASPLGFSRGETPYDEVSDINFSNDGFVCASGDNFVTNNKDIKADVVDMEAFSIAKACFLNNIEFECLKYITDEANDSASNDWLENCGKGIKTFTKFMSNSLLN